MKNPRYPQFGKRFYTAGDTEQFEEAYGTCVLGEFAGANDSAPVSPLFRGIQSDAAIHTFNYLFHKFKKGIYVRIQDNRLALFLPFSKVHFRNEWSHLMKVDPAKYPSIADFVVTVAKRDGYALNRRNVGPVESWYANNCLLRTEYPIREADTNLAAIHDFFSTLCRLRSLPDTEFFVNKRDFPILTEDSTEPYAHIWGTGVPLVSHHYEKYAPILSMSTRENYADLLIPTYADWAIASGKKFPGSREARPCQATVPWGSKRPVAVFRGSSTGAGVTPETNKRLKLAQLARGSSLMDAGITKWSRRPRKLEGDPFLRTQLGTETVDPLTLEEQACFKYIIHVEGHVSAFRLTAELTTGSVLLIVEGPWRVWYQDRLESFVHYVPVKADLSDLEERILWCRSHDSECEAIAKNARGFYEEHLSQDAMLDYAQNLLQSIRTATGNYSGFRVPPRSVRISLEKHLLERKMGKVPVGGGTRVRDGVSALKYSFLRAQEWLFRKSPELTGEKQVLFANRSGIVYTQTTAENTKVVVKEATSKLKREENAHHAFVGVLALNKLRECVPNFSYVLGFFGDRVVQEYVPGQTLHAFIKSPRFSVTEFLSIATQVSLAIELAQRVCGFCHYDLSPWNIVLRPLASPVTVQYIGCAYTTSLVPTILDYGRSHVVVNGVRHYIVKGLDPNIAGRDMYMFSVLSLRLILASHRLSKKECGQVLGFAQTMFNRKFRSVKDLKRFADLRSPYSALLDARDVHADYRLPVPRSEVLEMYHRESVCARDVYGAPPRSVRVDSKSPFVRAYCLARARQAVDLTTFSCSTERTSPPHPNHFSDDAVLYREQLELPETKHSCAYDREWIHLYLTLFADLTNASTERNDFLLKGLNARTIAASVAHRKKCL